MSFTWPDEVIEVMVNIAFTRGSTLGQFRQLNGALNERNWTQAALEIRDLCWNSGDCPIAKRYIVRMWNVKNQSRFD